MTGSERERTGGMAGRGNGNDRGRSSGARSCEVGDYFARSLRPVLLAIIFHRRHLPRVAFLLQMRD